MFCGAVGVLGTGGATSCGDSTERRLLRQLHISYLLHLTCGSPYPRRQYVHNTSHRNPIELVLGRFDDPVTRTQRRTSARRDQCERGTSGDASTRRRQWKARNVDAQ